MGGKAQPENEPLIRVVTAAKLAGAMPARQALMRRQSYVLLSAIVLTWIELSDGSQNPQLVGEAVCLSGFAWLGLGGWPVMQRCARRMKDGTNE